MPLFRFSAESPIESVEIASLMGQPQAILHPAEKASTKELQHLRANLAAKGIYCAVDRINGNDALVAHGLDAKQPENFLQILEELKATTGTPTREISPLDEKKS